MSCVLQKLKDEFLSARKLRKQLKTDVLSVVLGEIDLLTVKKKVSDDDIFSIVKGVIKSNEETLRFCGEELKNKLEYENNYLKDFLPAELSQESIESLCEVNSEEILKCRSIGEAIGFMMKKVKSGGYLVNGNVVRSCVEKLVSKVRS